MDNNEHGKKHKDKHRNSDIKTPKPTIRREPSLFLHFDFDNLPPVVVQPEQSKNFIQTLLPDIDHKFDDPLGQFTSTTTSSKTSKGIKEEKKEKEPKTKSIAKSSSLENTTVTEKPKSRRQRSASVNTPKTEKNPPMVSAFPLSQSQKNKKEELKEEKTNKKPRPKSGKGGEL